MIWTLLLDLTVASLLIATIVYAVRLSRRLSALREDRAQLQDMIKGLQKATQQAEDAQPMPGARSMKWWRTRACSNPT